MKMQQPHVLNIFEFTVLNGTFFCDNDYDEDHILAQNTISDIRGSYIYFDIDNKICLRINLGDNPLRCAPNIDFDKPYYTYMGTVTYTGCSDVYNVNARTCMSIAEFLSSGEDKLVFSVDVVTDTPGKTYSEDSKYFNFLFNMIKRKY